MRRLSLSPGLLVVPLAVLLAGCMKLEMMVDIRSDDEVSAVFGIGMERAYAKQFELTAEKMCEELASDDAEWKDTSDDKYISCRVSKTGPLSEFGSNDQISLTRNGDVYEFVFGTDELQKATEQSGGDTDLDISEIYSNLTISVTFPGPVVDYTGHPKVSGNTATWTDSKDLTITGGLKATGHATGSPPAPQPGATVGSISGQALAQLAVKALRDALPAGTPDPIIDCGTRQIPVAVGNVVDCELTDPESRNVYDATVTMTGVEGDQLFIDVKVADIPKRSAASTPAGTPPVATQSPIPITDDAPVGSLSTLVVIGLIVAALVLVAIVVVVIVLVANGSKKKAGQQQYPYPPAPQGQYPSPPPQGQYPQQPPQQYQQQQYPSQPGQYPAQQPPPGPGTAQPTAGDAPPQQ